MLYEHLPYPGIRRYAQDMFQSHGFSPQDSAAIADVLLCADLFGIESHGVQRLIRYHKSLKNREVDPHTRPEVVWDTPISAVMDAQRAMGQIAGVQAMRLAIQKARVSGIGMVTVRNSTHYGIAGYYPLLALEEDMIGVCMTNSESIAVPTFGAQPMLGTNPIAFAMPADPVPFWYDAATTVVPLGKMEVYQKQNHPLPREWAVGADGAETRDAATVIGNIRASRPGGLLPLGGLGEEHGGHKGYGLGLIVDICTGILSGGCTSPHLKQADGEHTSHFFAAVDYGIFGDKAAQRAHTSQLLAELRRSAKAPGQARIYTHGEKAWASREEKLRDGIPVQQRTAQELRLIAGELGLDFDGYFS